ncbi:MAG: hypothetical protein O4861_16430 [Trichodesmium sp. St16_bin4-tuft]|nr:hypothetical protein [Trichodesmium sp. MAG_R01]MDE5071690.1 hypothetical protein [Trichodesmium sp. St5_bin8]MDE5077889.1 hypothetical protein [Trichodesmium sp. St2_bin6]MDE5099829.1 hypothetical protein [Trichodesmium sp. St16_bin4-tuft]MDE5105344.1 hypothetical protein [Trichodesmium sp. St19_bin2]
MTEYIATNDLGQSSLDAVEFESQTRWKSEEFYTRIKQLTNIEFCQCRLWSNSKNYVVYTLLVWSFLKRLAVKIGKTIYIVKHELLSNYLSQELKKLTIQFRARNDFLSIFYSSFNNGNFLEAIVINFQGFALFSIRYI